MKRVDQRPLLIERERIEAEKLRAQRKALLLVKQSLEKAGIDDIRDFFSQEELQQLKTAAKMKIKIQS